MAYLDAERLVDGEEWEVGFSTALVNSLVFLPLLSAGSTGPIAKLQGPPMDAWVSRCPGDLQCGCGCVRVSG